MSRIMPLATHELTIVRMVVTQAGVHVRDACDEADALLTKMAKDKQCDDEDLLAIVAARTAISAIRKRYESE